MQYCPVHASPGAASERGRASHTELGVSKSPQPPSAEQSPKRSRSRVAKAGAAALLFQLHTDAEDDLLEDGGQRGMRKGRKAGAASAGKLKPLGALQKAAVEASTVGALCWVAADYGFNFALSSLGARSNTCIVLCKNSCHSIL